ncbi:MAG: signal recognition particle-docking protein FtsY [Burkholderiaceae bacterium]
MFGFLRRKKPGEPVAPVPDDTQSAPVEGSSPTASAAPVDATPASPPVQPAASPSDAAVPGAGTARSGFWSRFIPGTRATPANTPVDPLPADGATVDPAEAAAIEAEVAAAAAEAEAAAAAEAGAAADASAAAAARDAQQRVDAAAAAAATRAPERLPSTSTPTPADPAPSSELIPAPQSDRRPWLARLKQGLSRTSGNLAALFVGVKVDEALFEELESALLTSDTGFETTTWLLAALRERVKKDRITDAQQVKTALRALLVELLTPLERPIDIDRAEPLVVMIAGVNGAGKTTSIGKLARHLRREGKSVLLAAGDTFRAAAREQLAQWGSRNEVDVISQQGGDPAAVAFDAVAAGIARRTGVVMVDTAGRLPTQTHLMDELRKIRRVITKAMPDAPHEVLLVLDGNTGQNMLSQVKAFDDTVQLTGLVVTKLDGTAKGGALAALAHTRRDRPIPVYFIGVGEGIDDLQAFSAEEFAAALVG